MRIRLQPAIYFCFHRGNHPRKGGRMASSFMSLWNRHRAPNPLPSQARLIKPPACSPCRGFFRLWHAVAGQRVRPNSLGKGFAIYHFPSGLVFVRRLLCRQCRNSIAPESGSGCGNQGEFSVIVVFAGERPLSGCGQSEEQLVRLACSDDLLTTF
jgi:hypothetical protein